MILILPEYQADSEHDPGTTGTTAAPPPAPGPPTLEHTVRAWHEAGNNVKGFARRQSSDRRTRR
jgi:hypothetical protein